MAKKTTSKPKTETAARIQRTEAYANQVRALFVMTVNQILALNKTVPQLEPGVMFSFDAQSLKMQKEVERLLRQLHSVATMAIQNGIKLEWGQANLAADLLVKSIIGKELFSNPTFNAWTARNEAAMQKFINRSERGLNLSDRVWKSVRQLRDEMEVAITVAVGEGKSAQKMSQDVRKYLNDPDLMFRRFRYKKAEEIQHDENGNEIGKKIIWGKKWKKRIKKPDGTYGWIDYDRDSYKTGAGVYKSSAKNAMRVARTETNIAYRRADNERWNQMDFVLGQRINLSGDHPAKDICDKLAGDYPKEFLFDGWHPQCFCYVTPITLPPEETAHLTEMMLKGEDWRAELAKLKKGREITQYPDNFKTWVGNNKEKIDKASKKGTLPYFISNNRKAINAILNPDSKDAQELLQKEEQQRVERAQRAAESEASQKELSPVEQNNRDLEKALNIEQGKPMTFEEANEMRGNPHYAESEGYRVNCQTCVVANELRRRGFDVEALPNTKGSRNEVLSGHTEMIWIDENGNIPQSIRVGAIVERKRSMMTGKEMEVFTSLCKTKEELMSLLESSINIDGRYHIKWMWERPPYGRFTGLKGHIITAERINGEIRYYDPQNGRVIDDLATYANNLDLKRGIQFLRVDNLQVNPELAKDILAQQSNITKIGEASTKGTTGTKNSNIKADVSNYIIQRNKAQTNKDKVSLDKEIIKNENFVLAYKYSNGKNKIYATEPIIEENIKNNPEYNKNLQMAQKMVNNGYDVYLLSNPHGNKSADFLLVKDNKVYYTEGKLSSGKNSLNHNLNKGATQSERILIDLTGTKDTNYIASQLEIAFNNNPNLKEVKILKGGREIKITSRDMERRNFKLFFKKEWERKK